jgi:hypothetical protein
MANRCYLYSTNYVPGSEATGDRRAVGISEFGYNIPIAFKVLVSGNPRACPLLIFEGADPIAVVGDYDVGVARLWQFLDRVPHSAVASLKEEAQEFLDSEENRNPYVILEPREVLAMSAESLPEEINKLLAELADLEPQVARAIAEIEARMWEETHPPGFFASLFGARTPVRKEDSNDLVYRLGLGYWTNILFSEPKLT